MLMRGVTNPNLKFKLNVQPLNQFPFLRSLNVLVVVELACYAFHRSAKRMTCLLHHTLFLR